MACFNWEIWLRRFLKISGTLHSLPLIWDSKSRNFVHRKKRPFLWGLGVVLLSLDIGYQYYVLLTIKFREVSPINIHMFLSHFISRFGCVTLLYGFIFVDFARTHFNEILRFHSSFKDFKSSRGRRSIDANLTKYCKLSCIVILVQPIFGPATQFIEERYNFRYWGSAILPNETYDSPVVIILCFIHELGISFVSACTIIYLSVVMYFYIIITKYRLSCILNSMDRFKIYSMDRSDSEKAWSVIENYKTLQVLNQNHNSCFGPFISICWQSFLAIAHVVISVFLVKSHAWSIPSYYLGSLLLIQIVVSVFEKSCLHAGARIYADSCVFKRKVGMFTVDKNVKKIERSLIPLKIKVGPFYYLRMETFTISMKSILEHSVNVVLAIS